jgi:uncharacterized protein (DUF362 family)
MAPPFYSPPISPASDCGWRLGFPGKLPSGCIGSRNCRSQFGSAGFPCDFLSSAFANRHVTRTPLPESTVTRTSTQTPAWRALVATGRAAGYELALLRQELTRMLDGLGGLAALVKTGARVGIKVNLTGGTWWDTPDKPPATEFFVTHPALVGVLCELLRDAGASQLIVMDGLGDPTSFARWGYSTMAKPLGIRLVDLCKPDPYKAYTRFPVGKGASIYDHFMLNGVLGEVDVLVSVAKMKCHSTTGITLSMKNLVGLAPTSEYRRDINHNNRSAFHESTDFDKRLPRVVIDLNRACPIHLALIDGVMTAEAGAGPWDGGLAQVRPGLLVAGCDPVATDSVSAAIMGFDPAAAAGVSPFLHGDNHLILAHEAGLGTNRLMEVGIVGPAIKDLRFSFKPAG